ncbi:MAG: histidine--tRNA ligase [Prevotellaceae bacterium]|jgi:histidyl-tRNA synthetase|nr:histidine--tRNA ligase [Prevotellaceae bacterium]
MTISIPKGTRDFSPEEMVKRNHIFDTVKSVFKLYGYLPIETPAMENLGTLLGKYGEEGDKLLFKILNSGNFLDNVSSELLVADKYMPLTNKISEKGLRYDLTVPFARYVVQHRNDIVLPFRRYQIQPVWRADRPQKGRYREFFQCDADVVGSVSLLNEVELLQIIDAVFAELNIEITVKLNNRKILAGIAGMMMQSDRLTDITTAIDKIEKIGVDAVKQELADRGISEEQISILEPILCIEGDNREKLNKIEAVFLSAQNAEAGLAGIAELRTVLNCLDELNADSSSSVEIDFSLARGLNYYTGAIIEVKANNMEMGSICGGGRYDNLTGIFGMKDVSGVGISFGADRIYDVMTAKNLFPHNTVETTRILFANMGHGEAIYCLKALRKLRAAGISAEMYPDTVKLKKQMEYADKRGIPFVAIAGDSEILSESFTLKNMRLKTQIQVSLEELIDNVKIS